MPSLSDRPARSLRTFFAIAVTVNALTGVTAAPRDLVHPPSAGTLVSMLGEQDYTHGDFEHTNSGWIAAQSNDGSPFTLIHTPSAPIVFTHTGLDTGHDATLSFLVWDLDTAFPGNQVTQFLLDGIAQPIDAFEVNEPNESMWLFEFHVDASYLADGELTVSLTLGGVPAGNEVGIDYSRLELLPNPVDAAPPAVNCGSPDGAWHASDVQIACTAQDDGSGLASAGDAAFFLTTSVAAGTETASAATSQRTVCDVANNCITVGPIGGNQIDKRGPTIFLTSPSATTYVLGQVVSAAYSCTDGGSGLSACAGPAADGSALNTASAGTHSFTVSATDLVGNAGIETRAYNVSYGVCVLFDQGKAYKSGSTLPIKLRLCDAAGANVSGGAVPLTATSVYLVSTNAPGPLEDSGNANPDHQFRFDVDKYIFNLSLSGLSQGTYALVFTAGSDPAPHTVTFQVR